VFVFEIFLLISSFTALGGFQEVVRALDKDMSSNPPYKQLENLIFEKFNNFFYGAASRCQCKFFSVELLNYFKLELEIVNIKLCF
jgi:hypothetical protein